MKGWVYVIVNSAIPGLVKIGYSMKDPGLRAIELNHTGVPHPYIVNYEVLVDEPRLFEQRVHAKLSNIQEGKEWFRCSSEEAIAAIQSIVQKSALLENFKQADREQAEAIRIKNEQEEILRKQREEQLIKLRFPNFAVGQLIYEIHEIPNQPEIYRQEASGEIQLPCIRPEALRVSLNILKQVSDFSFLQYCDPKGILQKISFRASYNIRDENLGYLKSFSNLKTIDLRSTTEITDLGLLNLKNLSKLEAFDLSVSGRIYNTSNGRTYTSKITDNGLSYLKNFNRLQALILYDSNITDSGLAHLGHLDSLQVLDLSSCPKITDLGLNYLNTRNLQFLDISKCNITDSGLKHLQHADKLQVLYLSNLGITNNGLAHLKDLNNLNFLDLEDAKNITDAGLENLKNLNNLKALILSSPNITNAGLIYLNNLNNLEVLHLDCPKITDAGLAHIENLPNLEIIDCPQFTKSRLENSRFKFVEYEDDVFELKYKKFFITRTKVIKTKSRNFLSEYFLKKISYSCAILERYMLGPRWSIL